MFQSGVFRFTLLLVVVAAAAALLLARVDPAVVERAYARGLYPAIGQAIGGLTGRVAFSVTEPGAAVLGVGRGYALAHGWRQPRLWVALVGGAALLADFARAQTNFGQLPPRRGAPISITLFMSCVLITVVILNSLVMS